MTSSTLFAGDTVPAAVVDRDGNILWANRLFCARLGVDDSPVAAGLLTFAPREFAGVPGLTIISNPVSGVRRAECLSFVSVPGLGESILCVGTEPGSSKFTCHIDSRGVVNGMSPELAGLTGWRPDLFSTPFAAGVPS